MFIKYCATPTFFYSIGIPVVPIPHAHYKSRLQTTFPHVFDYYKEMFLCSEFIPPSICVGLAHAVPFTQCLARKRVRWHYRNP